MLLRVTQYDEPVLREKGQVIDKFDAELKSLVENMLETMYASEGIGLAAQQVGENLMLCVVDLQLPSSEIDFDYSIDGKQLPIDLIMPLVLVNPVVEPDSDDEQPYEEGCLSFPDIRGVIYRPSTIRCKYQDLDGVDHVIEGAGLLARVIQHEVDHLNGVLFIDRMSKSTLVQIGPKLRRLKRKTRDLIKAELKSAK